MIVIQAITFIDFAPEPKAPPPGLNLIITEDIHYLQQPINCVIAGQQKEPVKKAMGLTGAISGPLRGIFDE